MARLLYANEFQHESERRVARALEKVLPAEAVAVANYNLPSGFEFDFVVALPEGVLCLEVKHWTRVDRVGAFVEFADGYRLKSPFDGMHYKHKRLRSFLMEKGLISGDVAVGSALVTSGRIQWPTEVLAERVALCLDDLRSRAALLRGLEVHQRGRRLSRSEITGIAEVLCESASGVDQWRVQSYVIDGMLAETPFARSFAARSTELIERDVVLRCWEIDPLASDGARDATLRQVRAEASALARLASRRAPAIPIVYDAFTDPGNFNLFWVVLESIGTTTLAESLHRLRAHRELPAIVVQQLDGALSTLHEAGVVHRNVRSSTVFIEDERILLTGFEFSATEGGTIRRTAVGTRAPEERHDRASARTDLYDVGRMVLEWVRPGDEPIAKRLAKLKRGSLRSALEALLVSDPRERPTSLSDLASALRGGLP